MLKESTLITFAEGKAKRAIKIVANNGTKINK